MNTESLSLIIVPLSLGITGIVFLGIGLYLSSKFNYKKGGIKAIGVLVGFRKFDDYNINPIRIASGNIKYKDFTCNVTNSKPLIEFAVNERSFTLHSEWSVADLDKKDIGRKIPILYFTNNQNPYRIVLEGKQYEHQREKGRRTLFWIFASIGIALIALSLLTIIVEIMP